MKKDNEFMLTVKSTYQFALILLLLLFISACIFFMASDPHDTGENDYSYQLTARKTEINENSDLTVYYDAEGNPTFARDLQYAAVERHYDPQGRTVYEYYYDQFGGPTAVSSGYCGIERKYLPDESVVITYLDDEGAPTEDRMGVGKKIIVYSEQRTVVTQMYYNLEGYPTTVLAGYSGYRYYYNNDHKIIRVDYLDEAGKLVVIDKGYSIRRIIYEADGVSREYYYDNEDRPTALSRGQYGVLHIGRFSFYLNASGRYKFDVNNMFSNCPWLVIVCGLTIAIAVCFWPVRYQTAIALCYLLFILYETVLGRTEVYPNNSFGLFSSYRQFFSNRNTALGIIENIWLFVPIGSASWDVFQKKWKPVCALILLSVSIELIQRFSGRGYFDCDDIISNCIGILIGIGIACAIGIIKQKYHEIN